MVLACVLSAWYLWDRKLYFKQLYKSVKSNTLSSCLASDGNPNRLTSSVLLNRLTSSMLLNRLQLISGFKNNNLFQLVWHVLDF